MADPPTKKIGSLRDRIAAFENKGPAPTPASPPVPRPKPVGVSWKPRPASPPPAQIDEHAEKKAGGMSAADAKESIALGGSLKARMAALQGRTSIAGSSPVAPPPRPTSEKPKWKPPPVVARSSIEEEESPSAAPEEHSSISLEPPKAVDEQEASQEQPAKEETPESDAEEEEERRRRAAIAARIARLGGARVGGIGGPVFGRKPEVKKPEAPKVAESNSDESKEEPSTTLSNDVTSGPQSPPADVASPPAKQSSEEYFEERNASASSLLSPETSSAATPASPAMPAPAIPRRAAPPRRKTPKSPSPAPVASITDIEQSESPAAGTPQATSDDKSKELQEDVHKSKEDEAALGLHPAVPGHDAPHHVDVAEIPRSTSEDVAVHEVAKEAEPVAPAHEPEAAVHEDHEEARDPDEQETEEGHEEEEENEAYEEEHEERTKESASADQAPATSGEAVEQEDDLDDAARRKRIAERLRQQGGFNPFSAPPPPARKPSGPVSDILVSESEANANIEETSLQQSPPPIASPPPPPRRGSLRQDSAGSSVLPHPGIGRRSSVQSVHSQQEIPSSPPPVTSATRPVAAERKRSSASVHIAEQEQEGFDSHRNVLAENISEEPEEAFTGAQVADDPTAEVSLELNNLSEETVDRAYEADNSAVELSHASHYDEHEDDTEADDNLEQSRYSAIPPPVQHHTTYQEAPELPKIPSPAKRTSLPPPPRAIPPVPQGSNFTAPISSPVSRRSIPPTPIDLVEPIQSVTASSSEPPQSASIDYSSYDEPPLITETTRAPSRRLSADLHSPRRSLPPPPPDMLPAPPEEEHAEEEADAGATEASEYSEGDMETALSGSEIRDSGTEPVSPPADIREYSSIQIHPPEGPSHSNAGGSEREVLDDSDVDPIDPAFYSPQKAASSTSLPPADIGLASAASGSTAEPESSHAEEDEAQVKRNTIAARMAKLGGIRFGAPPAIGRRPIPPPVTTEADESATEEAQLEVQGEVEEEVPEEDEAARRQRIAARIAGMGGMRFGMFGAVPVSPAAPSMDLAPAQSESEEAPPLPPPRSATLRRTSVQQHDESEAESEGRSTSDVVQVEAEESELEEVTYNDVEEEAPPPVPPREGRRGSVQQPFRTGSIPRPPVPSVPPIVPPPTSRPSLPSAVSHGDFVMVDEADAIEVPPQLPPPRTASLKKAPPARSAPSLPPPPPPPTADIADSITSQWESNVDFGADTDLSLSAQWSEDSTQYPQASEETTRNVVAGSSAAPEQMSADDLMAQWGRVGVQIHEIATTLYEKSRKSIVGDRTYVGFINAVLNMVPNASKPLPPFDTFGYLIYEQSGGTVLRHASDIMPGDVILLRDAKLKGHKGLHMYQQTVGADGAVCAIIGDFELKKSKIKAFQANQHVGQESVESVSYRLEDLKAGSVKIFRVLEA